MLKNFVKYRLLSALSVHLSAKTIAWILVLALLLSPMASLPADLSAEVRLGRTKVEALAKAGVFSPPLPSARATTSPSTPALTPTSESFDWSQLTIKMSNPTGTNRFIEIDWDTSTKVGINSHYYDATINDFIIKINSKIVDNCPLKPYTNYDVNQKAVCGVFLKDTKPNRNYYTLIDNIDSGVVGFSIQPIVTYVIPSAGSTFPGETATAPLPITIKNIPAKTASINTDTAKDEGGIASNSVEFYQTNFFPEGSFKSWTISSDEPPKIVIPGYDFGSGKERPELIFTLKRVNIGARGLAYTNKNHFYFIAQENVAGNLAIRLTDGLEASLVTMGDVSNPGDDTEVLKNDRFIYSEQAKKDFHKNVINKVYNSKGEGKNCDATKKGGWVYPTLPYSNCISLEKLSVWGIEKDEVDTGTPENPSGERGQGCGVYNIFLNPGSYMMCTLAMMFNDIAKGAIGYAITRLEHAMGIL